MLTPDVFLVTGTGKFSGFILEFCREFPGVISVSNGLTFIESCGLILKVTDASFFGSGTVNYLTNGKLGMFNS